MQCYKSGYAITLHVIYGVNNSMRDKLAMSSQTT